MSDQIDRDVVARRIRALLAKTTENGATEAEAMAAAAKARELMDQYRLTMTDIEIQAEPIEQIEVDRPYKLQMAAVDFTASGIARYCGVKIWTQKRGGIRRKVFFGLKSDVEMARYLYGMLHGAIQQEHAAWKRGLNKRGIKPEWAATWGFQVGMANRINARLTEMARALEPTATTGSGTALVVVKNAVVAGAFAALGLKFAKGPSGGKRIDSNAYSAGQAAGDRVNLNRPVSAGRTADRLA